MGLFGGEEGWGWTAGKEFSSEPSWAGKCLGMSQPAIPFRPLRSPPHITRPVSYPLNENRPANSLRSCACAESSSLAAAPSSAVAELVWMMSEIWLIPLVTW